MAISSTGITLPQGVTENLGYQNYSYTPNGEGTYLVNPTTVTATPQDQTANPYYTPSDVGTPAPVANTPMGTYSTYYGTPWDPNSGAPVQGLQRLGQYIGGLFGGPSGNGVADVWGDPTKGAAYYIDPNTQTLKPFPSDVSKWSWNGQTGYNALASQLANSDSVARQQRMQQLANSSGIADYGLPIVLGAATLGAGGFGALGDLFGGAGAGISEGTAYTAGGDFLGSGAAGLGTAGTTAVSTLPADLTAAQWGAGLPDALTPALSPTQAGMDAFAAMPDASTAAIGGFSTPAPAGAANYASGVANGTISTAGGTPYTLGDTLSTMFNGTPGAASNTISGIKNLFENTNTSGGTSGNAGWGNLFGNTAAAGVNYLTANNTADKFIQAAKDLQKTGNPLNDPQRQRYQVMLSNLENNPSTFWQTNPVAVGQLNLAQDKFNAASAKMGTGGTQFSDYLKNVTNAASGTFNDQANLLAGLGGFNMPAQGTAASAGLTGQGINASNAGWAGLGNLFGQNVATPSANSNNNNSNMLANALTGAINYFTG